MKVSIAGGGPAGLIAALYLCRIPGAKITVYEKQEASAYRSSLCAEGISREKLDRLEAETGFCSTPFIAARIRGIRVVFPNRKYGIVRQDGATLKRTEWLRGMIDFLEKQGVSVSYGRRFFENDIVDSRWVIGADGPASKIRSHIGGRADLVPSVQYRLRLEDRPGDLFEVFVGRMFRSQSSVHGYGWIFPKGGGTFNVGVGGNYELLDRFLEKYNIDGTIEEKAAAPIGVNGTKFEKERVLLIGDAAGLTNPITCGGLSAIICCAGYLRQAISSAQPGIYTRLIKQNGLFPADWTRRQHVFFPSDGILNKIGWMSGNNHVNPPPAAALARMLLTPRIWGPCFNLFRLLPALKRVSW